MNDIIVNRWAMGLAVFSLGFLSIGSFLFGATATTSVLRGIGGALFFGGLLWLAGLLIATGDDTEEEEEKAKVLEAGPMINAESVRNKFMDKSREIQEKEEEEKARKEEEERNKKDTPF